MSTTPIDRNAAASALARTAYSTLPRALFAVCEAIAPLCSGTIRDRSRLLAAMLVVDKAGESYARRAEDDDRDALRVVHLLGAADAALRISGLAVTTAEIEALYSDAVERLAIVGVAVSS